MAFTTSAAANTAAPGKKKTGPYDFVPAAPGFKNPTPGASTNPTAIDQNPYTTTTPQFPGMENVLATDAGYQQLMSFDKSASAGDLATMNRNIDQMKAYYGSDKDPLSLFGRMYQGYQDRNLNIANTLGAHGLIGSGETGYQADRSTLAYQQNEYDAQYKMQQYIQGLQDSLRAANQARTLAEMQAARESAQNWITNNPPVTTVSPNYQPPPNENYDPINLPGVGVVGYVPNQTEIMNLYNQANQQAKKAGRGF